jgi:ferredoxin
VSAACHKCEEWMEDGYCMACYATLRAEVERLKADTQEENDKLSLAAFRNLKQHLALECDKIAQAYDIRFSSEKQLRADLAAAAEALRKIATHPIYGIDPIEIVQIARSFIARMEVKP